MFKRVFILLALCALAGAQNTTFFKSITVGGGPNHADGGAIIRADGSAEFSGPVVAGSISAPEIQQIENGGTGATTPEDAWTNLGGGTLGKQDADSIAVTGGTATGLTDFSTADTVINLGSPNLSLPSVNAILFPDSTGDGTAGSVVYMQACGGANGTTGNGGAGGPFAFLAGNGGNAAAGSGGNGGAGGDMYLVTGAGGAGDGVGTAGAAGRTITAWDYVGNAARGSLLAGTTTSVSGKEFVTVDASMATLDLTAGTVAVADGGTAGTTAAEARASLGITDAFTVNVLSTVMNKCTDTRLALNWWTAVADAGTQTGLSIYANTMTYVDASDWSAALRIAKGNVWVLSPASMDYCTIADAASLSFGDSSVDVPFTVALWCQTYASNNQRVMVGKTSQYDSNANSEWMFYQDSSDRVTLRLCDPSANAFESKYMDTGYEDGWHFFCAVYNDTGGTDASANITLYNNGVAAAGTTGDGGTYVSMENGAQSVGVFGENDGGKPFSGDMGFIVIDAAAWSATTVRNVYEATRGWYVL